MARHGKARLGEAWQQSISPVSDAPVQDITKKQKKEHVK